MRNFFGPPLVYLIHSVYIILTILNQFISSHTLVYHTFLKNFIYRSFYHALSSLGFLLILYFVGTIVKTHRISNFYLFGGGLVLDPQNLCRQMLSSQTSPRPCSALLGYSWPAAHSPVIGSGFLRIAECCSPSARVSPPPYLVSESRRVSTISAPG